jgi:hypothetical protein
MHFHHHDVPPPTRSVSRRGAILGTAAALVGTGLTHVLAQPALADNDDHLPLLPPPKPILGGDVIPPQIHAWEPGEPQGFALPFTGAVFDGLNVDPTTIRDFSGFTAQAYPVGTATGSDGRRYNLEGDIRVFDGTYVAETGTRQHGTFALI